MMNPTALLIINEWAKIMVMVERDREAIDEEAIERCVNEGFWSIVNTYDGEIEYLNMKRRWRTRFLFGLIDEAEYRELAEWVGEEE